jgi:hypothetical protein
MQQPIGIPVLEMSITGLNIHAMLALELVKKHPEDALAILNKLSTEPLSEAFLKTIADEIAEFLVGTKALREQSELMQAQIESDSLPKDKLN